VAWGGREGGTYRDRGDQRRSEAIVVKPEHCREASGWTCNSLGEVSLPSNTGNGADSSTIRAMVVELGPSPPSLMAGPVTFRRLLVERFLRQLHSSESRQT
jgi:hypothetical protein